MKQQFSLFIIDDHTLVRETWMHIIQCDEKYKVIGMFSNAEKALEEVKKTKPDIILLDINLPGMNGLEATRHFCKYVPGVKVVGVSLHNQPAFARQMMKNGAKAFVTKGSGTEELFAALEAVTMGNKYICKEIKSILAEQLAGEASDPLALLSKREIQIIHLLKDGLSSREIAKRLSLSVRTIGVHRYNVLKKLKLKNTASLIQYIHSNPQSI